MSANRSRERCALCGRDPARGLAFINGRSYCHEGKDPTCYMLAQWKQDGTVFKWIVTGEAND